jgi:hypothetical protein
MKFNIQEAVTAVKLKKVAKMLSAQARKDRSVAALVRDLEKGVLPKNISSFKKNDDVTAAFAEVMGPEETMKAFNIKEETYSPQKHEYGTGASRKFAKKKTPGQKDVEEAKYGIDIEGLPRFYMDGDSPGKVKNALRRMLKKPDMIKDVERTPDSKVKADFRDRISGKKKADDMKESKLKKDKDDPCWDGYVQLGTKKKNGKEVPNCVPKEETEIDEVLDTHQKRLDYAKKAGESYGKAVRGGLFKKKDPKTAAKRLKGMDRVYNKIAKEETELDEKTKATGLRGDGSVNYTLGNKTDRDYQFKVVAKKLGQSREVGVYQSLGDAQRVAKNNRKDGITKTQITRIKRKKLAGPVGKLPEETEIDEVLDTHQKRLDYARKAGASYGKAVRGGLFKKKDPKTAAKRLKGMDRVYNKIAKEETEIGEAMKIPAGMKFKASYVQKDSKGKDHKHTYLSKGKMTDPTVVYIDGKEWKTFNSFKKAQDAAISHIKTMKEENDTTEKLEMAQTQLHFIYYAAEEILDYIDEGGEVEEWYQNKLSKVHSDMESLHSYVEGEMRRTGMKEETDIDEQRGFKNKATASKGGSRSGQNRWDDAYRKLNVELEKAKKAGDTKKVDLLNKKKDDMMDKKYPMGEGLDPVNKDELKKKFRDRKDKDIDNDGDVDSSDEYLHNRRKTIAKKMNEATKYDIYHRDFSSAVQHAIKQAEKRGYKVDDDDWASKVAHGPRKPSSGKTNSYKIDLLDKNDKPTKKKLNMQVYNTGKSYELNMYVEEVELSEISAKMARRAAAASQAKAYNAGSGYQNAKQQKDADRLADKSDKAAAHVAKRQGAKGTKRVNRLAGKMLGLESNSSTETDLTEKSVSQAQQKLMGMALAYKRGKMDDATDEVKKLADSMSEKDLEDYAKTKHEGLPMKKESLQAFKVFRSNINSKPE